jgi:Aluminium activated malate transporter
LVLLVPRFVHVGPIESAVDRMLEVAVGGIIALAVSLLVLPARAHSFVIEGAARTLNLMAGSLPELFEGFIRPRDAAAIARIQDSIGEAVARTQASAAEAKHERIVFLAAEPDHGPLLSTLTRLRHDLVMIGLATAEPLPESLQARLGPLLARVAQTLINCVAEEKRWLAGASRRRWRGSKPPLTTTPRPSPRSAARG